MWWTRKEDVKFLKENNYCNWQKFMKDLKSPIFVTKPLMTTSLFAFNRKFWLNENNNKIVSLSSGAGAGRSVWQSLTCFTNAKTKQDVMMTTLCIKTILLINFISQLWTLMTVSERTEQCYLQQVDTDCSWKLHKQLTHDNYAHLSDSISRDLVEYLSHF